MLIILEYVILLLWKRYQVNLKHRMLFDIAMTTKGMQNPTKNKLFHIARQRLLAAIIFGVLWAIISVPLSLLMSFLAPFNPRGQTLLDYLIILPVAIVSIIASSIGIELNVVTMTVGFLLSCFFAIIILYLVFTLLSIFQKHQKESLRIILFGSFAIVLMLLLLAIFA